LIYKHNRLYLAMKTTSGTLNLLS